MGNSCLSKSRRKSIEGSGLSKQSINQLSFNQDSQNIFQRNYQIKQMIGKGANGIVYRVGSKNDDISSVVKIIPKIQKNEDVSRQIQNQYYILKKLDHPNIIKAYEFYQGPKCFLMITQMCSGGQLFEKIISQKRFNQIKAAKYCYQILEAVNYLHDNKIMHRDIKPQNLLLSDQTDQSILKLIDFGSAIIFQNSQIIERKRVGTSYYIAPEVLEGKYNQNCDIWSCGVILYILLSGEPPFKGKSDRIILKNVLEGKISFSKSIWKNISQEAKDLISKLLLLEICNRISIKNAMKHPWFNILNRRQIQKYRKNETSSDSTSSNFQRP